MCERSERIEKQNPLRLIRSGFCFQRECESLLSHVDRSLTLARRSDGLDHRHADDLGADLRVRLGDLRTGGGCGRAIAEVPLVSRIVDVAPLTVAVIVMIWLRVGDEFDGVMITPGG